MKKTNDKNIEAVRKFIKNNIISNTEFVGHENERKQIHELLQQTIEQGESNSALLIGPRASGKTTLVNDVLKDLQTNFETEAVLVRLNGLIHTDDRLALKSITSQMDLEIAADGKAFGSFADNLAFLLACLGSGKKKDSKCVIFVIEEFDLFCSHHKQNLLYNLFDVAQTPQTPVCVLGITYRQDVIEMLEKRVKSRFSHRQIYLFDLDENISFSLDNRLAHIGHFLLILNDQKGISVLFREQWNAHINSLLKNKYFKNIMKQLLELDSSEKCLKNILLVVVSQLNETNDKLTLDMFSEQVQQLEKDQVVQVLLDLSVLEFCLIISMKHHCDIYDNQPMNFEMVFNRFMKFASANSNMQSAERPVVMKAFEHIQNLELILMLSTGNSGVQKEYQLFKSLVLPEQIAEAVKKYSGLPTEVVQYANSSFI